MKKIKNKFKNFLRKMKILVKKFLEKSEWGRGLLDRRADRIARKAWKKDTARVEAEEKTALPQEEAPDTREKNRYISEVAQKSGWTYEEAEKRMKSAKKRLGITYKDYCKHDFHEVPKDQQQEKYAKLLKRREKKAKAKNEVYVATVMEHTGWDRAHENTCRYPQAPVSFFHVFLPRFRSPLQYGLVSAALCWKRPR